MNLLLECGSYSRFDFHIQYLIYIMLVLVGPSSVGPQQNCSTPDPRFTGGEHYKHLGPTRLSLSNLFR